MKNQEIFETVSRHLFTQGKRSVSGSGSSCLYRGPNGTSCAVGFLIPDDQYNPDMEFMGVDRLIANFVDTTPVLKSLKRNVGLLGHLQSAHDGTLNWHSSECMRGRLKVVGRLFKLRIGFLDELSFSDR